MQANTQHTITRWLITALAVISLTACIQEDKLLENENTTNLIIKVTIPQTTGTKAEGQPIPDQAPLIFKNGLLIFSDSAGEILYIATVVTGMSAGDIIGIDDLTSSGGVTIENVPKEVRTVDFFGNLPTAVTTPSIGTGIDDFRTTVIGIASQKDNNGGVTNVSIYGSGTINFNNKPYGAKFDASAILSRIEVAKLEADGTNIISFDLAGIFINYFYSEATLTGETDNSNFIQYTSMNVFEEGGEIYYSTAYKTILYDYNATTWLGQLNGFAYIPVTAGNIWTYNIFSGHVPHIIFRLKNVTASASYISGKGGKDPFRERESWYITVSGFKAGSTILTAIEAGEIYSLASIEVSPDTLGSTPEPDGGVLVNVEVRVMSWTEEDLSGGLPHFPW